MCNCHFWPYFGGGLVYEHLWQETFTAGVVFRSSALCLFHISYIVLFLHSRMPKEVTKIKFELVTLNRKCISISLLKKKITNLFLTFPYTCNANIMAKKYSFLFQRQKLKRRVAETVVHIFVLMWLAGGLVVVLRSVLGVQEG